MSGSSEAAAPIRMSPRRLVASVILLELASGLPFGVINEMVPVWLREREVDLATIGAMTLVGLPWTLKALWAPLVDRYLGVRTWMILGLCGVIGSMLALASLAEPVSLSVEAVVLVLIAMALASATQDIAIDGYIANATPAAQHGRANGVRVAAYRAAMALAGGGAVVIGDMYGWTTGFLALAVFGVLLIPGQLSVPTPPPLPVVSAKDWLAALYRWVGDPAAILLFSLGLVYKLGDSAMAPMVRPFWLDMGRSASEVGLFSTTVGAVLTSLGALLGGEIITRMGLARAFLPLALCQALSNLAYTGAALMPLTATIYGASVVESVSSGLGTAALMAVYTRSATGAQAATRFALLAALSGLTRTLAGAVSGSAATELGYAGWFTLTVVLAIPGILIGPKVCRRLEAAGS